MTSQRWPEHQRLQPGRPPVWLATPPRPYAPPPPIDWKSWCRAAERKRRAWDRARPVATGAAANGNGSEQGAHGNGDGNANGDGDGDGRATAVAPPPPPPPPRRLPREYLARVTWASFRMEGIELSEREVTDAMAPGPAHRALRPRQGQRVRNHMAILRGIECHARRGQPLSACSVVRWYTTISCGLTSAQLDEESFSRLDGAVRQINCPSLNLRPAIEDVARRYHELIVNPVVPSFNGILARLLLDCHLCRCGLPPALFDPVQDRSLPADVPNLLRRLLDRIIESYEALLASTGA